MTVQSDIKKLLITQVEKPRIWSDEEASVLLEFKQAGVGYRTIFNSKEIMEKYFPGRSIRSIKTKYYDVGRS